MAALDWWPFIAYQLYQNHKYILNCNSITLSRHIDTKKWRRRRRLVMHVHNSSLPLIAGFMGLTWDQPGSCRPQVGPTLAWWTLLPGASIQSRERFQTNEEESWHRTCNAEIWCFLYFQPKVCWWNNRNVGDTWHRGAHVTSPLSFSYFRSRHGYYRGTLGLDVDLTIMIGRKETDTEFRCKRQHTYTTLSFPDSF